MKSIVAKLRKKKRKHNREIRYLKLKYSSMFLSYHQMDEKALVAVHNIMKAYLDPKKELK